MQEPEQEFDEEFEPEFPEPPRGNPMGLVGFILSLVGVAVCVLFAPVALVFSIIGLNGKPKGFAVAGTIVSGLNILVFAIGFALVFSGIPDDILDLDFFDFGGAKRDRTEAAIEEAVALIEARRAETGTLPTHSEGNLLLADLVDGWERSLMYSVEGDTYAVVSAGPDAQYFNEDDIFHESGPDPPD